MTNPTTVFYSYRQRIEDPEPRYIIPLSDPLEFENPFDHLFEDAEAASFHLNECLEEEYYGNDLDGLDLVLVKITMEPVEQS